MVSQPNRLLQHSTMSLINKKTLLNLLPIFSNKFNRLDIGSQEVQGHTLVQQALLVVITSLFSNSLFLALLSKRSAGIFYYHALSTIKTQFPRPKWHFYLPSCLRITICPLYIMRTNLLNWCNLVSISKNVVFYVFGVVRIYYVIFSWFVTKITKFLV